VIWRSWNYRLGENPGREYARLFPAVSRGRTRPKRVVPRKTTILIFFNIHVQAVDNAIFLTASDGNVSMRTVCPAKVKKEGRFTVPTHKLYDYVWQLEDGHVTMRLQENNRVQIASGRSHTKMLDMAPEIRA
jgi:DNA polymerase-3 subunit beta